MAVRIKFRIISGVRNAAWLGDIAKRIPIAEFYFKHFPDIEF
jgi:hypothetical protein